MKLTKTSIVRPSIVIVIFAVLTALGMFGYSKLSYELMPDMSSPILSISTIYPGASPSEVENSVTKPIEDAVSSLEGIDKLSSTSVEGMSLIVVTLDETADVDEALQNAQRKINAIMGLLPEEMKDPSLGKFNFSDMPIMRLGVTASIPQTELYDIIENKIKPSLSKVKGVAQVSLQGGQAREIQVNIDEDRLATVGVSILQVSQAIQSSNLDFPTGKVKNDDSQTLIRLNGKFNSLEQLRDLAVVTRPDGSTVRLHEIAEVYDTQKEATILTRIDNKSAIGLTIQAQSDANGVEVSALTSEMMDELKQTYKKENLQFSVASDTSIFTLESADAVTHDLILAIILVAIVMLLFLHSIRNAIIVMISVPASIVATFLGMYLLGYSLNLMTLLALSLVVGILVDDAIVVIENIYRHLEKGKKPLQAAYDGIREISITVISITAVIIVVFVPISMSGGIIGNLLQQFSLTIAMATAISLFVAFTLIPLLASRFSKLEHLNNKTVMGKFFGGFEKFIAWTQRGFTNLLNWGFNHKLATLGLTLVLLVGSVSLAALGFIGSEFVASGDKGEFVVKVELPKNATLEQTNFLSREVEKHLKSFPEVKTLSTTVGTSTGQMSTTATPNVAEINVKMVDKQDRDVAADLFARRMKISLEENVVGAKFSSAAVSIMGTADEAPIQIVLMGTDLDSLISYSQVVMDKVATVKGTSDIKSSVEVGNPEISISVDRTKLAALNLSLDVVGANLQNSLSGNDNVKFTDGEYDYDISIKLDQFDRKNANDVRNLSVMNSKGQMIQLSQFATITESSGPSVLERKDRIAALTVNAQVLGRPVGTVGAEIQEVLNNTETPLGIEMEMGGQMEQQGDAFGSMGIALLASLFLVYLIMVALYNSFVYPLVVMFSIPLAIIGAFMALALTNSSLSIFSILGMIMLIGLVAKNAILVVDFTNQLKKAGMSVKDALVQAMNSRFRPILMTTLAMVIGMLPIALATGPGAEWKNGLAWVLIGGLISSMFLTLVVVPVIYYIFDRILARLGMDKEKVLVLSDEPLESSEAADYLKEKAIQKNPDSLAGA